MEMLAGQVEMSMVHHQSLLARMLRLSEVFLELMRNLDLELLHLVLALSRQPLDFRQDPNDADSAELNLFDSKIYWTPSVPVGVHSACLQIFGLSFAHRAFRLLEG